MKKQILPFLKKTSYSIILITTLLFMAVSKSFSATSFCVTINDVCCNENYTTGDYTVPAGGSISTTYVYYSTPSGDKVSVECWDIVGGEENSLVWSRDVLCGCGTISVTDLHPIGENHQLRFKVKCKQCTNDCTAGTSLVKIYTPSSNSCATSCQGS